MPLFFTCLLLFVYGLGLPQQVVLGSRPVMPATGIRPPMQTVPLQPDGAAQSAQQKSRAPGLDNDMVNQLSKDEQKTVNSSYQEAIDAGKKVFLLSFFFLFCFSY